MVDYNLDFRKILEVALLGTRRAAVFSTLGANSALKAKPADFNSLACGSVQLVDPPTSAEQVASYKEEFQAWVLASALREAMEAFAVFLDEVHHACALMAVVAHETTPKVGQGWASTFPRAGLSRKLELLRERYQVGFANVDMLLSVQKFRNCLSHRRGIVAPEDCSDEGVLAVVWPGIEMIARSPDGTEAIIPFPVVEPFVAAEGASISIRMARKTVTFGLGQKILLSHTQVNEVCWFLQSAAGQVCESAEAYAERLGFEPSDQP